MVRERRVRRFSQDSVSVDDDLRVFVSSTVGMRSLEDSEPELELEDGKNKFLFFICTPWTKKYNVQQSIEILKFF